jgi:predicted nucleic acid-binding Zn ribbon protein
MSPDDALRLADHLAGLFPEMTPQQVSFCADQFAPFDAGVVEAEVTRYRRQFDVLNLANLLRRIAEESQKRTPRTPLADRRAIDRQWEQVDAAIATMSDAELAKHKQTVLEANPSLHAFLADRDPRESVVLRSLIVEKIGKR